MPSELIALQPLQTIKVKINGRCMNACRFCTFHGRPERLEWENVERVLRAAPEGWTGQVLVNGGEPTLHPRFVVIAKALDALRPGCRVGVGSNLRLFEHMAAGRSVSSRVTACWEALLNCFDLAQIGCDDEHRNLEVVEKLVPELRDRGVDVYLNCLVEAASTETCTRLKALDARTGSRTRFSHITPRGSVRAARAVALSSTPLCAKRRRELLVDCDGMLHFCFNQELERPIGNLHALNDEALRRVVRGHVPTRPYAACATCTRFQPEHQPTS
jgi:hypothetical protein